jgi:hypothetical protein
MNHDVIAAHDVIARYVADRLAAGEEREFEAHLVDCAQCTEQVEQELALRDGLRTAAAERPAAVRPAAPVRRWSGSGLWLLQAAAAVLVALAAGLAFSLARTTSALNAALNERQEQQRRADDAARAAQGLERRVADLEARAAASTAGPLLPTTIFALTAVRGGAAPVDTLTLDRDQRAALVILTVDVPPGEYAVTLKDGEGRDVWSGGRFRPSQDVMAVAVERRLLTDGRYTLEVHRREASGQTTLAARYPFQIASR